MTTSTTGGTTADGTMEAWRRVWRKGVAPLLNDDALGALAGALQADDHRLIQGATTTPPPLQCVRDWPCEAACLIGYCGWKGDDTVTVGEVEEYFARMCFEADKLVGEPAAIRHLLNWWDDTPRQTARLALLTEVYEEQLNRAGKRAIDAAVVQKGGDRWTNGN